MNRWTPIQVALYVVVPIATLVGYIVGAAWIVGHYR